MLVNTPFNGKGDHNLREIFNNVEVNICCINHSVKNKRTILEQ